MSTADVVKGLEDAISDPAMPLQYSPLLMEARKLLAVSLHQHPVETKEVADELRKWWSFDDRQFHTHSWHDREDFIERVLPLLLENYNLYRNSRPALAAAPPAPVQEDPVGLGEAVAKARGRQVPPDAPVIFDGKPNRARVAYDTFRGGFRGSAPLPSWDEAPAWLRDVVHVAYLQGTLDAQSQDTYWRGWNDACDAMCDLSLWKRAFAEMKGPVIVAEDKP